MEHNIKIKNAEVLSSILGHVFHPVLIDVIVWVAISFGLMITEGWRPRRHASDLHGVPDPVRAIDLRSWFYRPEKATQIEQAINNRWIYDPNRPNMKVAMIHKVKGGALHFHIQVHPNTVRRGE